MWGLDSLGLPFSTGDGMLTVPLWAAGLALALVLVFFVLALIRTGAAGTLMFLGLLAFGVWGGWRWMENDRAEQRRTIDQRLLALEVATLAPASPLPCLDAAASEPLAAACERVLFQTPEAVNAAVTLTSERLVVLAEGSAYAKGHDGGDDGVLDDLRSRLERDRYGIVAQVLLAKGCTPERCDQFRLLRDPERVRNNMRERTFETIVARNAPAWPERPLAANAAPAAIAGTPTGGPVGMVATPVSPRYNLPSATSIPPVSIMATEPAAPPAAPAAAATAPAETAAPAAPPPRRPVVSRPAPRPPAAAPPPRPQ